MITRLGKYEYKPYENTFPTQDMLTLRIVVKNINILHTRS